MIEIGRLCVKIAGRDAGKKCIIIDILEGPYVMIDGETRRRKCNIAHLEPLEEKIDIKKGASHDESKKALEKISIPTRETKAKKKTIRPRKLRRSKLAKKEAAKEERETKPAEKKIKKQAEKPKKEEK
ncbi:50S ribosomal protein L14e [Candidatus Woesearchaeota archaeon]|nr:50S ribosomal protein L14e [Candidatus Woesearchaeota archaeon]